MTFLLDFQIHLTNIFSNHAVQEEHMPRGIPKNGRRKSRKPSIATAPAQEQEQEQTGDQPTLLGTVAHHLNGIHAALNAIAQMLAERNDIAKGFTEPEKEAPAKRGRPPKPAPAPEPPRCEHMDVEKLSRPGLGRCKACNMVLDIDPDKGTVVFLPETQPDGTKKLVEQKPVPAAQAVVAVPTAPAPAPAPKKPPPPMTEVSVEDTRAAAIGYASKHGKPALAELLKKFGAANISSVVPEQRAALVAELTAG
jgi:hypothetical protein